MNSFNNYYQIFIKITIIFLSNTTIILYLFGFVNCLSIFILSLHVPIFAIDSKINYNTLQANLFILNSISIISLLSNESQKKNEECHAIFMLH